MKGASYDINDKRIPPIDTQTDVDKIMTVDSNGDIIPTEPQHLYQHNIYLIGGSSSSNSHVSFTLMLDTEEPLDIGGLKNYFNTKLVDKTISCVGYVRFTIGHVTAGHDFIYRIGGTSLNADAFAAATISSTGSEEVRASLVLPETNNKHDTDYSYFSVVDDVIRIF